MLGPPQLDRRVNYPEERGLVGLLIEGLKDYGIIPPADRHEILDRHPLPSCGPSSAEAVPPSLFRVRKFSEVLGLDEPVVHEFFRDRPRGVGRRGEQVSRDRRPLAANSIDNLADFSTHRDQPLSAEFVRVDGPKDRTSWSLFEPEVIELELALAEIRRPEW